MNAIDSFVEKANNFIRDIYYYIIPGTLLLLTLVSLSKFWFLNYDTLFNKNVTNYSFFISICLLLLAYVLGQILYTISNPLFKVYNFLFQWTESYKIVKVKRDYFNFCQNNYIENSVADKQPNYLFNKKLHSSDCHIYFEMTCFKQQNDIHRTFIERQNTMKYLKRMLSSCFFVIALLIIATYCFTSISTTESILVIASFILSFIFSILFFWDYLNAEIMFLDRVLICFLYLQDNETLIDTNKKVEG